MYIRAFSSAALALPPQNNLKKFPRPSPAELEKPLFFRSAEGRGDFEIYTTESDFPSSKHTQTNHKTIKNRLKTVIDTTFF